MIPLVGVQFIFGQFIDNPDDKSWSFWLQKLVVLMTKVGRSDAEVGRPDAKVGRPDAKVGRPDAKVGRSDDKSWSFQ